MRELVSYMKECNLAIKNGCRELNLKLPEIYYVELHENVRMYDNEGNIISYDYRDIGYDIKNIKFIPKEYVIYINIELFNNEVNMLVKCYQTIRHAYQIIQVHNKIHSKPLSEDSTAVNSWEYCYFQSKKSKGTNISPVEADMMSFSIVMMNKYHHINIKFKDNNYYGWDMLLKQLKSKRNELSKQFGVALENHDIKAGITALVKQDNLFDEIIKTYDSMIEKGN